MGVVSLREFKEFFYYVMGMFYVILGALMNAFVIIKNNLKMPVWSKNNFVTDSHFGFTYPSEVNHFLLADIIKVSYFYASIGDLFLFFGSIIIIVISVKVIIRKISKR